MRMPKVDDRVIQDHLPHLPGWTYEEDALVKTYEFEDFARAMQFVNRLAELAEIADHHPDMDIRYNKVKVRLTTHDSGGVTENDLSLAQEAEAIDN